MKPKLIETVPTESEAEEVSFLMVPQATLRALHERAAQKNMTVAQLLKKAVELALQ